MRAGSDLGELVSQDLGGSPVRSSRSRGLGPVRDRPYLGPVHVFGDAIFGGDSGNEEYVDDVMTRAEVCDLVSSLPAPFTPFGEDQQGR